jgi:hypothetical protein
MWGIVWLPAPCLCPWRAQHSSEGVATARSLASLDTDPAALSPRLNFVDITSCNKRQQRTTPTLQHNKIDGVVKQVCLTCCGLLSVRWTTVYVDMCP